MKLILTMPSYAKFRDLVDKPYVESFRLNTALPVNNSLENILLDFKKQADPKKVWIDLKCRQLRIVDYNVSILNDREVHYITLSHKIKVKTPTGIWIDDGNYIGKIEEIIDGNVLKIPGCNERNMGLSLADKGQVGVRPSMSVNILDKSLEIIGYLTERDKEYIKAAKKIGIHDYMLSYVEKENDLKEIFRIDRDANIIAKIESNKGLQFVREVYPRYKDKIHLMAARGDLYVEVDTPDLIIDSCEEIIKADSEAMFASRIFQSFKDLDKLPKCADLFDVYCGMKIGYKRFLIGDDICLNKDSLNAAVNLFSIIADKYKKYPKPIVK